MNKALVDLPKTQSHVQKRWLEFLRVLLERIRQNARNYNYEQFYCNGKYLRFDVHFNYTSNVSTE